MSADGKPACCRTRILTDSARKRKRKEVLANYNKTRIKIAHHHDHCHCFLYSTCLPASLIMHVPISELQGQWH
jgi:hypothetical protein